MASYFSGLLTEDCTNILTSAVKSVSLQVVAFHEDIGRLNFCSDSDDSRSHRGSLRASSLRLGISLVISSGPSFVSELRTHT